MDIWIGAVFIAFFGGFHVWTWGCWVCCALVTTAPIGALSCQFWARRQGLDAARCARLGALYWACGFLPWVYFALQIQDRAVPRRLMTIIHAALFVAWLMGPVIAGFFWSSALTRHDWLVVTPFASLLALPTALVCLAIAEPLPVRRRRVHNGYVVASLLGSMTMLTWLPHRLLAW